MTFQSQRSIAFGSLAEAYAGTRIAREERLRQAANLKGGRSTYSLGSNLHDKHGLPVDFWTAGAGIAARYFGRMRLRPQHRVIEYGCGSLRVGAHFIRYLDPGNFFGLDVVEGFYEIGEELIGPELLAQKRPTLSAIAEDSLVEAEKFGADFVYSNAVCVHVHPEEIADYFNNLRRLTHARGARLFFNAKVAEAPCQHGPRSWAWPLEFYRRSLAGLDLIAVHTTRAKRGDAVRPAFLEFERTPRSMLFSRLRSQVLAGQTWCRHAIRPAAALRR